MIKYLFILFSPLILTFPCLANEYSYEYLIDRQERECCSKTGNTVDMMNCTIKATMQWKAEINKYYDLLLEILPKEDEELLIDSQKKWIIFRDQHILFINSFYDKVPATMYRNLSRGEIRELFKDRALNLKSQYYFIEKWVEDIKNHPFFSDLAD